MAVNVDVFKL